MMNPREKWTDERLDDLNKKVDEGFAEIKVEMRKGFEAQDARFVRLEERFDAFNRTLWPVGGMIFAALLGIIATQL